MKDLGQKLTPGGAALIVPVRKVTPDKVLPQIQQYGGEVIQTSLDDESEARLRAVRVFIRAGAMVPASVSRRLRARGPTVAQVDERRAP
jgi:uncharacterized membrane protein